MLKLRSLGAVVLLLGGGLWSADDGQQQQRGLHFRAALELEHKGDIDGAILEYREAVKETPQHADSHYNLARLLAAKRDYDGAIAEYRQALRINPGDADIHNNLGIALKNKGDLEGAESEYREALRLSPNHPEAHGNLGNLLYSKKNIKGAMIEYRIALQINPSDATAHMNLGSALDDGGDTDGAISEYREAIRLQPTNANAHYNLAISLAKKRDGERALAELREAAKLAPNWFMPHIRLATLLMKSDPRGALDECRIAEKLANDPKVKEVCKGLETQVKAPLDSEFKLALPDHQGQVRWSAPGFKIIESSVKPNGHEIGIRGTNESGSLTFLGFIFLFPEQAPMTSIKCQNGVMEPAKKENPKLKVLATQERAVSTGPPISIVSYVTERSKGKPLYSVRGFVAAGDMCGDLEFYSEAAINADDADLKTIFGSYRLDESYTPRFVDAFLYAQLLYKKRMYKAAAPVFETALVKLNEVTGPDARTMRRMATDQAGMAYGMSGDIPKARAIFQQAIQQDPDYPMYYYNLACADAEEKKLADARVHLQEAFARKANVLPGEKMPDPTKDDSFLPHKGNKDFWAFVKSLQSNQQ